ncbi:GAF domain-like [Phytophthora cactorum]|nr:GAF domain-like [Phytophthora cactorum]
MDDELNAVPLHTKDPLIQEKLCKDAHTISVLKQRLLILEREVSASTKYRHVTEKQIAQLSLENQRLQVDKTQQQTRIEELDKAVLRQHHEYDKLAARYAAVYANFQKLVDRQNPSDTSAQQSALQALARENQDFLRKLRVLEARHAEDKTLTSTQDKKIKRLKAEIEALQHMSEAKNHEEDFDESASDIDQLSRLTKSKKRSEGDNNHGGRPTSASSPGSNCPGISTRTASHLATAEAYQYIDPNILKVLEKVDSQFSITNAINLSVVLKKWLNSCVHVVCSTHLPTVLQTLLKRVCELLHCEHAALFTVDHATRKLVATCSERGPERWELPLDKGITGYAARHNSLCNVHCANDDPRFYSSTDSVTGTTSREVLALPIVHELQLYLESHGGDGSRGKVHNSLGVFAVLRAWNTTHQKPFSSNDQILGSLLAIQAGTILRQAAVTKTLQKINHKTHQILQMPSDIVAKSSASKPENVEGATGSPSPSIASLVELVAVAQKELGDCLGIKQVRIFVLDAAVGKLWHVGECESDDGSSPALLLSALSCYTATHQQLFPEPSAEAAFNELWISLAALVSRVAKARLSASPFTLTASEGAATGSVSDIVVNNEREAAQQTEDRLMLELLGLFCRVFAGLLHHVSAQQLYDSCPPEIMQAQLATLTDHLDNLARRQKGEDEDDAPQVNEVATPELHPVTALVSLVDMRPSPQFTPLFHLHAIPGVWRETTYQLAALQSGASSDEAFPEPPATGDGVTDVDVPAPPDTSISTRDIEDRGDAQAMEPGDSELPVLDPELQTESDMSWPAAGGATESGIYLDPHSGDNGYAAAQDEEQYATADGPAYTWGDNSAYDPSLWEAGENVGAYEEGVAWDYGGVHDGALKHEDEDGTSRNNGGSHLSYDIDLRTSSAETDQPHSDNTQDSKRPKRTQPVS